MKNFTTDIDISFAEGLDTKTDPKRVQIGKFLELENTVFTKNGLLQKRYGNAALPTLPDTSSTYLTTFNGNLTAIGTSISALNAGSAAWVSKGSIQPLSLDTLPLVRNNFNQQSSDTAISTNGLICVAYEESDGYGVTNKYAIYDATTSQNIVAPTVIPVSSGTVSGGMRVFFLGTNFVIVFTNTITATQHLQYVAISSLNPTTVTTNTDVGTYVAASTLSFDGVVSGNSLYLTYNSTVGGQSIKLIALTNTLSLSAPVTIAGYKATMMSTTVDNTNIGNPTLYASFYDSAASKGYSLSFDRNLNLVSAPVQIITATTVLNITSSAQDGTCSIFYEVSNTYGFDGYVATNYINTVSITPNLSTFRSVFSAAAPTITASATTGLVSGQYLVDNTTPANITAGTTFTIAGSTLTLNNVTAGNSASSPGDSLSSITMSSTSTVIRSLGLASKSFIINSTIYFLAAYDSTYQPSYFLINGSSRSSAPIITGKLAYSNGGGYLTHGLPNVSINDTAATVPYLYKNTITPVNKDTNVAAGTQITGVYSQLGINVATFTMTSNNLDTAEIGNNLNLSGGFLWMYDGVLPVENNFFLYPDIDSAHPTLNASYSTTGGSMVAKPDGTTNTNAYYYRFTYEWTDNQGNAFRSAPSIPVAMTTSGSASTGSATIHVPTLRVTYKVASPVKIVIYRWSVAQQVYYQVTSVLQPLLNSTTTDYVTYTDTSSDATILGNSILYTTGGTVENISAPGSDSLTLFDSRLWLVDAEDRNLLWFSKQIIESTPVEMSDLFTKYIAPTTAAQGNTGPIKGTSVMDDKFIIFKRNAMYYFNGAGPDNTGTNNQYSEPIFITSTVGCENEKSVVFIPEGLMFQSDKGIWLLSRNLQTAYIGAPVESFTQGATVKSAQNIPGTNQVRFILDTGITLMYDYFYQQWGTFTGIPAISSTIYENLSTFINDDGEVYQEAPGSYVDGANPVLIKFKTGPIRVGKLQNYQRAYFFYLLGDYISPFKLLVSMCYNYDTNPLHSVIISPTNYQSPYGTIGPYGQGSYGAEKKLDWRVFLKKQQCMAFSINVEEVYDPSLGVIPGAGFTLSGISANVQIKSPSRPQGSGHTVG